MNSDAPTGTFVLRRQPGRSLWEQLVADLRRRLDSDELSSGFPGELALLAEFEVSPHTVRQAVKVLRDEGRVVGTRGRPSRQAEPQEIVPGSARCTACTNRSV